LTVIRSHGEQTEIIKEQESKQAILYPPNQGVKSAYPEIRGKQSGEGSHREGTRSLLFCSSKPVARLAASRA